MINLAGIDTERAALLMLHFQADVFSVLSNDEMPALLDRANALIRTWRTTGRPVVFANFALGAGYESVNETNRLISNIRETGLFREPTPVNGLDLSPTDRRYSCPRANVFHGTTMDSDLRAEGVDTLVMAGIASTGVLFSTVGWSSDADYRIYLVRDCCYDPDAHAHEALFRTSFATRCLVV